MGGGQGGLAGYQGGEGGGRGTGSLAGGQERGEEPGLVGCLQVPGQAQALRRGGIALPVQAEPWVREIALCLRAAGGDDDRRGERVGGPDEHLEVEPFAADDACNVALSLDIRDERRLGGPA